ncbi:hypothetical protein EO98_17410 [Methanosarcina sp. 2.H.T.1A.6]|uniref:P-loop NTPase n=1 Tax=unclassified Methanosarcina TaxID=2644672 RepID=UPI000622041E|nr:MULTISPECIES: hypothetical protein [unclassified Methanosarcina]KKG14680.1 hypothetical protein EO94_01840 [Methanosarcina sp. 2.H.T.1A.3]KKG16311.1 hypothetical protein EO97_17150 [Methanosarcina sp. 2.H.T.1A.15]KKG22186.1 hypothetical protein EO96_07910 [Methanosarcina sp. 2.H.T.1A.8]KKG24532.1 hypothetical protein EO98_17410 [Methanosarcina sp. 2.H.T.1A.6]
MFALSQKNDEYDALFKSRFHGATNIHGIRYQILYSILRAFELYDNETQAASITLEGIEDVDVEVVGLRILNEYVQVKSSSKHWTWSNLKSYDNKRGPIQNFIDAHRVDSDSNFLLVFDFELKNEIEKISRFSSLPEKEREELKKKFRELCRGFGGTNSEADAILNKLNIVSLSEEETLKSLRKIIFATYDLGSDIVEYYIKIFISTFLKWAEERKKVLRKDLEEIRVSIQESVKREEDYQAYGRGLIDRISWEPDASIDDFFEGKNSRPGHIVCGADVRRDKWIERIENAFASSNVCVLRSSSGQGKSALLYRYAYENWPSESTYILQVLETNEQVEKVKNYLKFRKRIQLPILLLIDNAGFRTPYWPQIAQECSSLGFKILLSIRNEDWYRYSKENLTHIEIVEPTFDLIEAKEVYNRFKEKGKIALTVESPEWAYEKIGDSRLFIEYIYLITHGKMLEERLQDQIRQILNLHKDVRKIELIRRISLADTLGVPIIIDKLLEVVSVQGDPQDLLLSLSDEYISINSETASGLHWVRSNHLVKILHNKYPPMAKTALSIIESVPSPNISTLISNALTTKEIDNDIFLEGLAEKCIDADLDKIFVFLEGIYEAGECLLYERNQNLFEEAFNLQGSSGIRLLSWEFSPLSQNFLSKVSNISNNNENIQYLNDIASKVIKEPRGLNLCHDFLTKIVPTINEKRLVDQQKIGRFLNWCSLSNVKVTIWESIKDITIENKEIFNSNLDSFADFSLGLYRYDEEMYVKWFLKYKEEILGCLLLKTNCVRILIKEKRLCVEFFVGPSDDASKQAITRLEVLRSIFPFCDKYQSRGIWILPFELIPSYDPSIKDISYENLPIKSDIQKNVIWNNIVESHYYLTSLYEYEKLWYDFRIENLEFIKNISKLFKALIEGKSKKYIEKYINRHEELKNRLNSFFKDFPILSNELKDNFSEELWNQLKEFSSPTGKKYPLRNWFSSLNNFFHQISIYIDYKDSRAGKLAVSYLKDSLKYLTGMHKTFESFFNVSYDYFNAKSLDEEELKAYYLLADLFNLWINEPPRIKPKNALSYIRQKKEFQQKKLIFQLNEIFVPLKSKGMTIIMPENIYVDHPLKYLIFAFSVKDPRHVLEKELITILESLLELKEIADFFYLVPLYNEALFCSGGYKINSNRIAELLSQLKGNNIKNWEAVRLQPIPKCLINYLPTLEFRNSPVYQIQVKIFELVGMVQVLKKTKDYFEPPSSEQNEYILELCKRQKNRLLEDEKNLAISVIEIKDYLLTEFSSQSKESHFKELCDFLSLIEISLESDTLDKCLDKLDNERISNAITLLE